LDHYKTTLAIVLVLFFSSIALVPPDLWSEFFAASDSGEFFGSNRNAKRYERHF
jgi:HAE1 family hydrophobic/amphiphilic exporter-1